MEKLSVMRVKVFDLSSLVFLEWHKRLKFFSDLHHGIQVISEVRQIKEHEKSASVLIYKEMF